MKNSLFLQRSFNVIIATISCLTIGYSQNNDAKGDSILLSLGISPRYFTICKYSDLPTGQRKSNPYDLSSIMNDTFILPKIDTFQNRVSITNKTIPYKLDFSGCTFLGGLDFGRSAFKKEVWLANTLVKQDLIFGHASFFDLVLHGTKCEGQAGFGDSRIETLIIYDCEFKGLLSFWDAKLGYTFIGGNTMFLEHVSFYNAVFEDMLVMKGPTFKETLDISNAVFLDSVYFSYGSLDKDFDLFDTRFSHLLYLGGLDVKGRIWLCGSVLPRNIIVDGLRCENGLNMSCITDSIDIEYLVDVSNAEVQSIDFMENFNLWFSEKTDRDKMNSTYKQVLDNMNSKGYIGAFENLDIKYRQFINQNYHIGFDRFTSFLNKHWWNYGYNKEWILRITICFILLYTIIVGIGLRTFLTDVYTFEALKSRYDREMLSGSLMRRCLYYPILSFLYTLFVFTNIRLDFDNLKFDKLLLTLIILLIYATGLICIAFILNWIFSVG